MNMAFYSASVGALQQQERLNVVGNNIANVNTYGFKAERPSFSSLMYGYVNGIDNAELPRGSGAKMSMASTDFSSIGIAPTNRAQDYAIIGSGFFGLVNPATGERSYTRDGSFTLSEYQRPNAAGVMEKVFCLSDGEGNFVLDQAGKYIEVKEGALSQPVGVYDFINTDGMEHIGSNRFVPVAKNGAVRAGTGTVQQGVLETSTTDLATEMTKIIESQRSYSYALKMVQTADEVETTINNLRG